jgi:hypothetical protein
MRDDARHNEASALYNARLEEREKWLDVVESKDAALADKEAAFNAAIADKDAAFNAAIAGKDYEIARLRALLDGGDK